MMCIAHASIDLLITRCAHDSPGWLLFSLVQLVDISMLNLSGIPDISRSGA